MSVKKFTNLLEARDRFILMAANATLLKEPKYQEKLQCWRESLICMMPDSKDGHLAIRTAHALDRFQMDLTIAMSMEAKPLGASREELDDLWTSAHDSAVKYGKIAAQYGDLMLTIDQKPENKTTVKMGKVDKPIIYN